MNATRPKSAYYVRWTDCVGGRTVYSGWFLTAEKAQRVLARALRCAASPSLISTNVPV